MFYPKEQKSWTGANAVHACACEMGDEHWEGLGVQSKLPLGFSGIAHTFLLQAFVHAVPTTWLPPLHSILLLDSSFPFFRIQSSLDFYHSPNSCLSPILSFLVAFMTPGRFFTYLHVFSLIGQLELPFLPLYHYYNSSTLPITLRRLRHRRPTTLRGLLLEYNRISSLWREI